MRWLAAIAVPALLGGCSVFPEFNTPEESLAKAPRTSRQAERTSTASKTSPVLYESGIWLARHKPEKQEAPGVVQTKMYSWEVGATDRTLKQVISRWAASAGWQLVWDMRADYEVEARISINGTFEEAMESVALQMQSAEVPMRVIFYKQNKVVRIVAKGAE